MFQKRAVTRSQRLEPLTAEAYAPFGDVVDPLDVRGYAELTKAEV